MNPAGNPEEQRRINPAGNAESMETLLRGGLAALNLPVTAAEPLCRYGRMLSEWNRVMNLTAITSEAEIARLHFLDSCALAALADFHGKSAVDVGTGAGFPGLPLRMVEPSIRLTLLDAQRKRVDFLRAVCNALELSGVDCVQERAEIFAATNRERFDIAVSRAVAALPVLAELCLPLVRVGGCFLSMKSVNCDAELSAAECAIQTLGGTVKQVSDYTIPGSDIPRRLIVVEKTGPTPSAYPRAFAKIKKNPL